MIAYSFMESEELQVNDIKYTCGLNHTCLVESNCLCLHTNTSYSLCEWKKNVIKLVEYGIWERENFFESLNGIIFWSLISNWKTQLFLVYQKIVVW
jgi:hypothetical protein